MQSPILEYLARYGVDPAYIIIGFGAITLILLIVMIVVLVKMRKLYQKYDRFMRGKDMESMEETVVSQFEHLERLEELGQENQGRLSQIEENMQKVYQKIGLVKYDAFREMSGKLSYAMALLDQNNNGVIITSMYSREGCYSYAKEIIKGESYIALSEEEKEALDSAINGDKIL